MLKLPCVLFLSLKRQIQNAFIILDNEVDIEMLSSIFLIFQILKAFPTPLAFLFIFDYFSICSCLFSSDNSLSVYSLFSFMIL